MRARVAEKVARAPLEAHRQRTWLNAIKVVGRREREVERTANVLGQYKLVKGRPVPARGTFDWARSYSRADRIVARTEVGDRVVSTVFLGLDHSPLGRGAPVLWETLVFCDPRMRELLGNVRLVRDTDDEWFGRYTSRADALRDHARIVAEVRKARLQ